MARKSAAARDLIEDLVHQFSDPFAFYRELIQNAIDAGSSRIEVTLQFRPGRDRGVATAQVQDRGEGMNRDIIENYLLTKFRSSKEGDLSKIGKFGIGFMSVFAPDPELVVVETGRGGESWRLLLLPDRTYELLRSPEPLEGTRVTLHKEMTAAEYSGFAARSREAIERWCRHSEADVTLATGGADGSPPGAPVSLRQALTLDAAPFHVEHREEGTHIIAGPSRVNPAPVGLYNRGLTLLETDEPFFPGVTFKVVSRYLEHTLTRDNVRRDAHFERTMGLVKELIEGPLCARLPGELQRLADRREQPAGPDAAGDSESGWRDYLALLEFARGRVAGDALWFRRAAGGAVEGKALRRSATSAGALLHADGASPLVEALDAEGLVVLHAGPEGRAVEATRALLNLPAAAAAMEVWTLARPDPGAGSTSLLCQALQPLLAAAGAQCKETLVARVHGAGEGELSVRVEGPGRPTRGEAARRSPFVRGGPPVLCLNAAEPRVGSAVELAARAPRLAALLLARLLAASWSALDARRDWALTTLALER